MEIINVIKKEKECVHCGEMFTYKKKSAKFCCLRCQQMEMRKKKFKEEPGMVSCSCCDMKAHDLTKHIIKIHNMTIEDYKEKYNTPIRSEQYLQKQSERVRGNKNPAFQHGGKFSPLSDKFIHADTTNKEDIISKISESNKNNGNNPTTLLYWTKQGLSEEEAKKKLSERQTTFSLDICIEKYGKKEGTKVWNERQKKWMKSYKRTNFSAISQTLFWNVYDKMNSKSNIYFATLDEGVRDDSGKNHEYVLNVQDKTIKPDFFHSSSKSIIEFDGDYWHGEKRGNQERDRQRDKSIIADGFRILHIKERDYKSNPEQTIDTCLEFLNG